MTARFVVPPAASLLAIFCAALGTTAGAQSADQTAAPVDDQANSAAALKDAAKDPGIAHAERGEKGIWKWVVPPVRMNGAFDNHDPIGLIAGKKIPADCSINWADPDTHRLFCFASATSLVYFLDAPKDNTAQAEKVWRQMKRTPTG